MSLGIHLQRSREERNAAWQRAKDLLDTIEAEDRAPTDAEEARLAAMSADLDSRDAKIKDLEALEARGQAADAAGERATAVRGVRNGRERRDGAEIARDLFSGYLEQRSTTTASGNGAFSSTFEWPNFWPELVANSVALASGVRVIDVDYTNFTIAAGTALPTASWHAEAGTATATDAGYDKLTMTPVRLAAFCEFSEEALDDPTFDALASVQADMFTALGVELDRTIFEGSGTPPEPRGMLNWSGINTIALNGPIVNLSPFVAAAGSAYASHTSVGAWAIPPVVYQALGEIQIGGTAGYDARPLLSSDASNAAGAAFATTILGKPAYVAGSMTVTGGTAAYALGYQPSGIVVARRRSFSIRIDNISKMEQGLVRLYAFGRFTVGIPRPKVVQAITGIDVSGVGS